MPDRRGSSVIANWRVVSDGGGRARKGWGRGVFSANRGTRGCRGGWNVFQIDVDWSNGTFRGRRIVTFVHNDRIVLSRVSVCDLKEFGRG